MATVSFTQQPTTLNFPSPGRGAEQWHDGWEIDLSPFTKVDKYYRFQWYQFENGKDQYTFTDFDNQIREAIDRGGKFGFGVMTCFEGVDQGRRVDYPDGSYSSYPAYLHTLMQSESVKDGKAGQCWVPNWNSSNYLSRLEAVLKAINTHLDTTYNGIKLRDAISYIDIRGFGNYGEWHTSGIEGTVSNPTVTSFKRIIDAHITAFPDIQLVSLIAALDGGSTGWSVFPTPAEVSYYLLTAKNNVGDFGWRRDSLGSQETYYSQILENNKVVYNGVALKTLIMNKYKTAPIVGEPNSGVHMDVLPAQVKNYHMTSFGNGNYNVPLTAADNTNVKAAALADGYRLTTIGGNVAVNGSQLTIGIDWQNKGITPIYENWDVLFELKGTSFSGKSSFKPRLFLPQATTTTITDTFTLPSGIPAGNYQLTFRVIDPKGYRKPLSLAITGQLADGSYSLGNITVSPVNVPNQPPVVNAGSNSIVQLPQNSVILQGSATDTDGTIKSSNWILVNGPNTPLITASGTKATISGLIAGIYVFKFTAVDDKDASSSSNVTITVNAIPNQPPTVSAGQDIVIELPVNSVQLNGIASDVDGLIAGGNWVFLVGPTTPIITKTSLLGAIVSNLVEGIYGFELTVIDDKGASNSDTLNIKVLPKLIVSNYQVVKSDGSIIPFKEDNGFIIQFNKSGTFSNIIKVF